MTVKVQDIDGHWIFIAQVGNVCFSESSEREIEIDRATIISGSKLRRIFDRLKLDKGHLEKKRPLNEFLDPYATFAYVHHKGKPKELDFACHSVVREELEILSASQLYYCSRRGTANVGLVGEVSTGWNKHAFLSKNSVDQFVGKRRLVDFLEICDDWKSYHKPYFFHLLLRLFKNRGSVSQSWVDCIRGAVRLVGRSMNSKDVGTAFLWNMIALEMLIARQGDKYAAEIPKRIEALIGWITDWRNADYRGKIEEVYKLRCNIVHDGTVDQVEKKHLLFSDDLLMNVLTNLIRHPRLFRGKNDVITFAEKVNAEGLLARRTTVRPKTLTYVKKSYGPKDLAS